MLDCTTFTRNGSRFQLCLVQFIVLAERQFFSEPFGFKDRLLDLCQGLLIVVGVLHGLAWLNVDVAIEVVATHLQLIVWVVQSHGRGEKTLIAIVC